MDKKDSITLPRKVCYGSTYRVAEVGFLGQYAVLADGVQLGAPSDLESAVAVFAALTA